MISNVPSGLLGNGGQKLTIMRPHQRQMLSQSEEINTPKTLKRSHWLRKIKKKKERCLVTKALESDIVVAFVFHVTASFLMKIPGQEQENVTIQ